MRREITHSISINSDGSKVVKLFIGCKLISIVYGKEKQNLIKKVEKELRRKGRGESNISEACENISAEI